MGSLGGGGGGGGGGWGGGGVETWGCLEPPRRDRSHTGVWVRAVGWGAVMRGGCPSPWEQLE